MARLLSKDERVQRFLARQAKKPGWSFGDAPDVRQQAKCKHRMPSLLWATVLSLAAGRKSSRGAEFQTERMRGWARGLVPERISDTTLQMRVRRFDDSYLSRQLEMQIRHMQRDKLLEPATVPLGVATIDGKNLATLDHSAGGRAHERSSDNDKWHRKGASGDEAYWLVPVLRATLTSAWCKPCILQEPLPPGVGEAAHFPSAVRQLERAYGRSGLIEVIDGDAGLCSLENANYVHDSGYMYVFGLKGNQPLLHQAAQVVLYKRMNEYEPEAVTPWEPRDGKRIRRLLWRSPEIRGFETSVGAWEHIEQVWLVRQETRDTAGNIQIEDRFFITSIPWRRLTPSQIVAVVRGHWGVENDTFNSLDVQWREDHGPWSTKDNAVWALGVLRLMAYNIAQLLRRRHLCKRRADGTRATPVAWSELFEYVREALRLTAMTASVQT